MAKLPKELRWNWIIIIISIVFILSIPMAVFVKEIDISTFFGLYIPASLGVIGSYALYKQRQRDRRRSLRHALKVEINRMPLLQHWPPENGSGVPAINVLSTTVFESNSMDLGLLSEEEQEAIMDFYTSANAVQEALQYHGEVLLEYETLIGTSETGKEKRDRIKQIMNIIDGLAIRRHVALYILDRKMVHKEPSVHQFTEGEILTRSHPVVKRNPEILLRYDLLIELNGDGERYRVTEKGQAIFEGELGVDQLGYIGYQLGGLEEKIEAMRKYLIRKIREVVRRLFS